MPVDPRALLALELPERRHAWTGRDAALYALATGFAQDPTDEAELDFVLEERGRVSPGFVTVACYDDSWIAPTGLDWRYGLHAEQELVFVRPLPAAGAARARSRIAHIVDRGTEKGLYLRVETEIADDAGAPYGRAIATVVARGDGGSGYVAPPLPPPHVLPARAPDLSDLRPTQPNQALFYRLCGDRNPLHAEPAAAGTAGYPRPILHGLCTYGFAVRAVLRLACDWDPARLRAIRARFTAPVFPGDLLRTEVWRDGAAISFRVVAAGRETVVLNNGWAQLG